MDPHNWNENERRVFIWFIIFYSYFLEQEAKPMVTPPLPRLMKIGTISAGLSSTKDPNSSGSNFSI